ncbi:MAG TPA: leishmanolysin-related zinc metalloendopeptidase [Gemmatimonadaceae bacterium]|nr:leishmanolysin-related zinc metalloendopeptidase [Gemmatimonadaceae bacterium]
MRLLSLVLLATAVAACSDGPSDPSPPGPPASLAVTSAQASARAGTALATPVTIKVQDDKSRGVPNQTVTFTVVAGGGTLAAASAISDAQGIVTLPTWTLGKSAVPQTVRATLGSITADVPATVTTAFNIDVRFFGSSMTAEQQALFTNAAARISAIIAGDVINVGVGSPVDLSFCGTGLPTLPAGQIDDVVIYAAVQDIDGPGKVLAQAGPCLARDTVTTPSTQWRLPAVGVMNFDSADLANLAAGGRLQDVITHEMMHVIGVGTVWRARRLMPADTSDFTFTGEQGRAGCIQVGGSAPCAVGVPVENTGGAGTRGGHWRESVFDSELMTGFAENGAMPISHLTIGSLADLGYSVNANAADTYTVPNTAAIAAKVAAEGNVAWEQVLQPAATISRTGEVKRLPRTTERAP